MSKPRLSFSGGGPKTQRGKMRSSQNSRRHGFFASEFSFSTADEVIFNKFSEGFLVQLKPDNPILDFLAQDVVASAWRVRMALRYEQQELQKQFAIEREGSLSEPQAVGTSFLYPPNAWQAIKLLDELKASTQSYKSLPPEFEQPITEAFGADTWKTFKEWMPLDLTRMWVFALAKINEERDEIFGTKSPHVTVSPEEEKKFVKADGVKQLEMVCKLIDVYKILLITSLRSVEKGGMCDERASRLDLAIRYLTTARREFYRSLQEYREAKDSADRQQ